jgi:hypothetical protein
MVNNAVVVPSAVFGAIAVVCLMFIVWWFPRTWAKGNAEERMFVDVAAGHTDRGMTVEAAEVILQRFRERHKKPDEEDTIDTREGIETRPPQAEAPPTDETSPPQYEALPPTETATTTSNVQSR